MASTDAVESIEAIQNLPASEQTAEQITSALGKLSKARDAFAIVETSLYYTDPEVGSEAELLPSTLATSLRDLEIGAFKNAETALKNRLKNGLSSSDGGELNKALQQLAKDVDKVAIAWRPAQLGNFRNAVFLPDSYATGRILQGAIAKSDLLVLASLQPQNAEQISREIRALKAIFDGKYSSIAGRDFAGKGLFEAYADIQPEDAERLRARMDSLELSSSPPLGQPTLDTYACEEIRDKILKMAAALGYEQVQ